MPITVNNERIADDIMEQELQMLAQRYSQEMSQEEMQQKEDDIREDAKQNAIERLILIQEARKEIADVPNEEVERKFEELKEEHGGEEELKKKLDITPEMEEEIKGRIADGIKLEQYFEKVTGEIETPDEQECREYYDSHKEEFEYPEMLRAAHIVRQPEAGQSEPELLAEMMNTREALLKGAPFDEMANARSQCDDNGGDLGWFPRGQMVPEFENVVFEMEPDEISNVFQTPFGFHIVKLLDKREAGIQDFEDVRYEIENQLLEAKKNERIGEIVDRLRTEASIEEIADETEAEEE